VLWQLLPLQWDGFGKVWDSIFEKAFVQVASILEDACNCMM
jgi:hypothetical protein